MIIRVSNLFRLTKGYCAAYLMNAVWCCFSYGLLAVTPETSNVGVVDHPFSLKKISLNGPRRIDRLFWIRLKKTEAEKVKSASAMQKWLSKNIFPNDIVEKN